MSTTSEIKSKIKEMKAALKNVEGSRTEVYTRIVGYYRPVQNWNKGKAAEYTERVEFGIKDNVKEIVNKELTPLSAPEVNETDAEAVEITVNDNGNIKKYKLFYSDNCPGCPPVKNYLKQVSIEGEEVNASTQEGFDEAVKNNITGTPTVLFLDDSGTIITKAHTPAQIAQVITG